MPAESEIRRVDLQGQARRCDCLVFRAHRGAEVPHIGLVIRVEVGRLELGDNAGRGGIHEPGGITRLVERAAEPDNVLVQRLAVLYRDRSDAPRTPVGRRAAAVRELLQVVGEIGEVRRRTPRAVPVEAGQTVLDIGGVGDLAEFAVRGQVDADGALPRNNGIHSFVQAGPERGRIESLAALPREKPFGNVVGPRKAADMGRLDMVCVEHVASRVRYARLPHSIPSGAHMSVPSGS